MSSTKAGYATHAGFVMAAAGGAIGLGNLWRFPFLAGENGGGVFVILYLISIVMIAMPIMLAELVVGRAGGGSAIASVKHLTGPGKASPRWRIVGVVSIVIPFIGIAYYSVVGGWVVDYTFTAIMGQAGLESGEVAENRFNGMLADPWRVLLGHTVFMTCVILVLIRGVQRGIERASKILMPCLFLFMFLLVIYAAVTADFGRALSFLLVPDFSKMTGDVVVMAVGQAFFSLAIGVGMLMTYGAYMPPGTSLRKSVLLIAGLDTMVALMAGLIIFPFVFSNGLDPSGGPGLIFVTLPTAFGQMTGGWVVGLVFFLLLFCAAFSTGIGTLEPVVAWVQEKKGMTRLTATWLSGGLAWALGILVVLSFNVLGDVKPLNFLPLYEGKNFFDVFDFTISSILLPFNGILICLFVGWALEKHVIGDIGMAGWVAAIWKWSLRLVVPIAILVITFSG